MGIAIVRRVLLVKVNVCLAYNAVDEDTVKPKRLHRGQGGEGGGLWSDG